MSIARHDTRPRLRPRARSIAAIVGALALLGMAATGFGASTTPLIETEVLGTISLTDPVALQGTPPICTDAVAPLDTDNCTDVAFTSGAARALDLGELSGTDVQAGSLRWLVTTTSPTGYRVRLSNPGPAPVMRSTTASPTASIADMPLTTSSTATALASTHFGVAAGDAATDSEGAVGYVGSPWVSSGQQGELFAGIPTGGIVVAERTSPQVADPFTLTFAATSVVDSPATPTTYRGTVRVVASII